MQRQAARDCRISVVAEKKFHAPGGLCVIRGRQKLSSALDLM